MELDQEQKNILAQQLRYERARRKAEELGVEITDLMERVVDGKSFFVKKSEVYQQLGKQRQLLASKKIMRSLRDGQNSLAARIRAEIQLARGLLKKLTAAPPEALPPLDEFPTALQKLENRVNFHVRQLQSLEDKIERIKSQNPVFAQAETVLQELYQARQQRDTSRIAQLSAEHGPLLQKYEAARKTLKFHIDDARQCRLRLQIEYGRILKIRFRLLTITADLLLRQRPNAPGGASTSPGPELPASLALIQKQGDYLRHRFGELSTHCPAGHLPILEASKTWDQVLRIMGALVDRQAALVEQCKALRSSVKNPSSTSNRPPRRMAFADQRLETS
ncbi:MAG: hypothetical protein HPY51_01505 [Candidatus Omnitrophica bacterium]|nr:hypothetical protein [Candidatus Omnitrophota bacterium]